MKCAGESTIRRILILCGLGIVLGAFFLLPKGFGSWFALEASRIYSGDKISMYPDSSLSGYLAFIKSVTLITNMNDFRIFNILAAYGILASLACFVVLTRRLRLLNSISAFPFVVLPLVLLPSLLQGYVLGMSLPLVILALAFILVSSRNPKARYLVIWTTMFISLSFVWHSAFGAVFSIVVSFYFFKSLSNRRIITTSGIPIAFALTYFLAHWFFFLTSRTNDLIAGATNMDLVDTFVEAFRSKGNLAQGFSYSFTGNDLLITKLYFAAVYLSYALAIFYGLRASATFAILKKSLRSPNDQTDQSLVVASLLLATGLFVAIYFLASRIIAPFLIIAFLMPIAFAAFAGKHRKSKFGKLAIVWTTCLIMIGAANSYVLAKSAPEYHMSSDSPQIEAVVIWISESKQAGSTVSVYADANTYGNLLWRYSQLRYFGLGLAGGTNYNYIDYNGYVGLLNGTFYDDSIYVNCVALYREHLQYGSLTAWNYLEPIPPTLMSNFFGTVLDTGNYLVYTPIE